MSNVLFPGPPAGLHVDDKMSVSPLPNQAVPEHVGLIPRGLGGEVGFGVGLVGTRGDRNMEREIPLGVRGRIDPGIARVDPNARQRLAGRNIHDVAEQPHVPWLQL